MYFAKKCCWLILLLSLAACGDMSDDLFPSGTDKRPPVSAGTTGPAVGQNAPDFAVSDTNGNVVTLASALATRKGVVLYFTMWCPICDSHMSDMLRNVIPSFPDVGFFAVDYVSGSVDDARSSAVANGYAGTAFTILADINQSMLHGYQATMGTTVVIDSTGIIRMNEDYRDGSQLRTVLAGLP
jgi:peroxiredoxin